MRHQWPNQADDGFHMMHTQTTAVGASIGRFRLQHLLRHTIGDARFTGTSRRCASVSLPRVGSVYGVALRRKFQ